MIELTLEELAVIVIGACFVLVVGAVCISRWSNANARRRGVRCRVICRLCHHAFEDHGKERHPVCPECGACNERRIRGLS